MTQENGKVTVAKDEHGNTIRVSKNNPEFGYIRVVQDRVLFSSINLCDGLNA